MRQRLTAQKWASTKKKNKYGAKQTVYNGVKYHSKAEANYARELDIKKKASNKSQRVIEWERQVPYKIYSLGGHLVFTYYLDFKVYYADGRIEHIDVKGVLTTMSKMKIKAVEKEYNIEIKLVKP